MPEGIRTGSVRDGCRLVQDVRQILEEVDALEFAGAGKGVEDVIKVRPLLFDRRLRLGLLRLRRLLLLGLLLDYMAKALDSVLELSHVGTFLGEAFFQRRNSRAKRLYRGLEGGYLAGKRRYPCRRSCGASRKSTSPDVTDRW